MDWFGHRSTYTPVKIYWSINTYIAGTATTGNIYCSLKAAHIEVFSAHCWTIAQHIELKIQVLGSCINIWKGTSCTYTYNTRNSSETIYLTTNKSFNCLVDLIDLEPDFISNIFLTHRVIPFHKIWNLSTGMMKESFLEMEPLDIDNVF